MKRQARALIINKQSERQMFLSAGLMLIAISGNTGLMAGAQSMTQDTCLPPEVIPVNAAIKYTANTPTSSVGNLSVENAPGIVPAAAQPVAQPAFQSAQEARQAMFNSLMGTNVYPQFSGQNTSFNQTDNMAGGQNLSQSLPQTLSNSQDSQSNLITPNQYNNQYPNQFNNNNLVNAAPSETQTLSGATNTPSTSQPRTSGGIGRVGGLLAGVGMSGVSLANSGPGNIYSAGLMGASMLNYGFRSGFSF